MQRLANLVQLTAILVALAVGTSVQPAEAESLSGTFVRIVNGDTVVLKANGSLYRVRLAAIDAPERDQPWGEASTRSLSRILAEKEARVDYYKKDRRGRLIGYVRVAPLECPTCGYTLDAGLYQLTVGMAWYRARESQEQTPEQRGQYKFAEEEARAKGVGLWSDPAPVPPWDWRNRRKN